MKNMISSSRKNAFTAGFKAISPVLVGVFPFATITGVTLVSVGIDPLPSIAMSVIVFAGASQLAAAELVGDGAPFIIMVLTALVINMRFMMYSASIAPHLRRLPLGWKGIMAYLLTDQAYAVSIAGFEQREVETHKGWFYLGAAIPMWVTWQAGTVVGVGLGLQVPAGWSLDFAIPLTFMSILIPTLKNRGSLAAAAVSGLVSMLAFHLPLNTGLIVAATTGIIAGMITERRTAK